MEYSIAHESMNSIGEHLWPDKRIPWEDAVAPDLASGDKKRYAGRLRSCPYCGSMHPADVVAAIKAGATGSWADWKYGWPHKAYFNGIPNPHAGMLESRAGSNQPEEGWVQVGEHEWRDPGRPAEATTWGKFYSVHLKDATPQEKEVIEAYLGYHFEFDERGGVAFTAKKVQS